MSASFDANARALEHYRDDYYQRLQKDTGDLTALKRMFVYRNHVGAEDSVLDFGCGDGAVLAQLPAERKAGVEVNPVSRQAGVGRQLDIRSSLKEFQGESFSRIISSHVLEHVVDPAATLANLRGYLAPDGQIVLVLPMNDCRDARHRHWRPNDSNMHIYAWTPLTLGNLLTVAGYQPQSIEVLKHTYASFTKPLARYSPELYFLTARLYGMVKPRHQLIAVARPAADALAKAA